MNSFIFRAQRRLKIIDSSKLFQGVVIAVILLSALLIGAKTHNLSANAMAVLTLLDLCITIFFVIEITIRFFDHNTTVRRTSYLFEVLSRLHCLGGLLNL